MTQPAPSDSKARRKPYQLAQLAKLDDRDFAAIPFFSYQWLLDKVRPLSRSSTEEKRQQAVEILERLARRYPHALSVGQELVFALMQLGKPDDAREQLRVYEKRFATLDEEILGRWGRLFKEEGDRHLAQSQTGNQVQDESILAAEFYRKSLAKYTEAYRLRGHYYPGINVATLHLILASLGQRGQADTDEHRGQAAEVADALLKSRDSWKPTSPDDSNVWFPATEGEAYLLQQKWHPAGEKYQLALAGRRPNDTHSSSSMREQVKRILRCYAKLDIKPGPPFDDLPALFGLAPTEPPTPSAEESAPSNPEV